MRRIGLFGGTFNPPHLGHKMLALEFAKAADLDKIIVMPTFIPPHKQASTLTGTQERLEMCRLTFDESIFIVSDLEIKRGGKSYTYDTLAQLKKIYPNDELYLIIGSDMLLCFDKWYRYRDILSMCKLCVISRKSEIKSNELCSYAENILHLSIDKGELIVSQAKPFEVSSTQIRDMILHEKDVSGLIDDKTYKYIREKGLYNDIH